MLITHCLLCKNRERLVELYRANFNLTKIDQKIFSARRTPDRVHCGIVKCQRCGLIFSTPILSLKEIFSFYRKSKFNYAQESVYLKRTYGSYLAKILPQKGKEKLRLLEIGCGNGFFLEEARRLGVGEVYGVEPSKDAVLQASVLLKKNIKVDFFRPGLFKGNLFDIICSFHTLDHVADPNSFLGECHQLLKKGGKIFFVVHDTDGLSVKLLGEKSPIFDIEHIYLFNQNTLGQLLKKNQFTKIQIFQVKNTYPLSYWMRMTPLPTPLKPKLLKILEVTKLGIIPISLKAGNIGVIAQK